MRLIDADALKKLVKEFRDDVPQSSVRRYVCNAILSMFGDENQTPTIDVVPVVRCKDCKHCDEDTFFGRYWCSRLMGAYQVKPGDFCSCGERKDGD